MSLYPRYYPHFKRAPNSLIDKIDQIYSKSNRYRGSVVELVERLDYLDEQPVETTKPKIKRQYWNNRQDYLFMLVFASTSFHDVLFTISCSLKYGGYVIMVYPIINLTITLVFSYVVVFMSVYTKKTVLNFGNMIPAFTGFGYLLLLFAIVRAVSEMRLFTNFFFYLCFSFLFDFTTCEESLSMVEKDLSETMGACIEPSNKSIILVESGNNENCKVKPHSFLINCGHDNEYILSTSKIADKLFFNIQVKYCSSIMACCCYGIMLFMVKKEIPTFIKSIQAAFVVFFGFNVMLVFLLLFWDGHEKGLQLMFGFNTVPTSSGILVAVTVALPKLAHVFVSIHAVTGRLPLCTIPAIDAIFISFTQVVVMFIVSASNLMMIGVLTHEFQLPITTISGDYVPFSTAPFVMTVMPISARVWILLYFAVHCTYCFFKELVTIEAIYVNVNWHQGLNKLVFALIYAVIIVCFLWLYLVPDSEDINNWKFENVSINLPLISVFSFAIFLYGVSRLEEDIAFMTSTPPAELMLRLIRILPVIGVALLIWCKVLLVDTLDTLLHYGVLFFVVFEIMIRLIFTRKMEGKNQFTPTYEFGPPNCELKAQRNEFRLETRTVMQSSACRGFFDKGKKSMSA